MNPSSTFKQYASQPNHGGYFESCGNDNIDKFLSSSLTSIKNCVIGITKDNADLSSINYGFTCKDNFSAHSSIFHSEDIIAISACLPLKILSLAKAASTLKYERNSGYWLKYTGNIEYDFNKSWKFRQYIEDESFLNKTGDYNTDHFIGSITEISIRFIGLHEFFHIAAGHTRWLKKTFSIASIDDGLDCEFDDLQNSIGDIKKILEWDADCHAIHRLVLATFNAAPSDKRDEYGKNIFTINPYGPYGVWQQAAYFLIFSITVCYFFLFNQSLSISRYHPDNLFRMRSSIYYILQISFSISGIHPETMMQIVIQALGDSKKFWVNFSEKYSLDFDILEFLNIKNIENVFEDEKPYREKMLYFLNNGLSRRF
ncbi:Peptidase U49 OS=Sphingobium scionense OX=1404341 GN=GGQ90_004387 PE=4 SV=1 [Sphingobium scionense]